MNLIRISLVLATGLLLITACSDGPRPKNVIETKAVSEDFRLETSRLDVPLFANSHSLGQLQAWHQKELATGPEFYKTYLQNILQVKPDSATALSLYKFTGNPLWKELQGEIEKAYPNTDTIDGQLTRAFGRLKQLLPTKSTPSIYYFNSAFNIGIWPDTNLVGIGLEWYLGKHHRIVKQLPSDFPQFQRDNMEAVYIPGDVVKAWLGMNYFKKEYTTDLLEYMVFNGKLMYAAEAALAPIADSVLFSYTSEQMAWCYEQEQHIWQELVKKDLIFSTRERDMQRMTADGPFTPGFPQNGAPMAGVYIGWKMVADYMKKNPDTSLETLLTSVSGKQILKAYKPKK
ncbi:MAG: hypothetical protein V4616_00340 [Bacteroidota bacterium]